jgi:hypothetical protein
MLKWKNYVRSKSAPPQLLDTLDETQFKILKEIEEVKKKLDKLSFSQKAEAEVHDYELKAEICDT